MTPGDRRAAPLFARFGIFIPVIMGAGLLFGLGLLIRDAFDRLVGHRLVERRSRVQAHELAAFTLTGQSDLKRDAVGTRSRLVYLMIATFAFLIALAVLVGSTLNYLRPFGYVSSIAWLWALSLVVGLGAAAVGATAVALATRPDAVPARAWTLVARSPLARPADPLAPHPTWHPLHWRGNLLRSIATVWVVVASALLLVLAASSRVPRSPSGGIMGRNLEEPIQIAMVAIGVVGIGLAWFAPAAGAVLLALAAALLTVFAAFEYSPGIAYVVGLAFFVPALLVWLSWQRTRSFAAIAWLAFGSVVLVSATSVAAGRLYEHYWGASHPSSPTVQPPAEQVDWIWSGAITPTSATVVTHVTVDSDDVRLLVSPSVDLSDAITTPSVVASDEENQRILRFAVDGLQPDTAYHYAVQVDGRVDEARQGRFQTFPDGAASFRFAFSSCSRTGSTGQVFDAIRETDPTFFLVTGDFFYANIDRDDPARFRKVYDATLRAAPQAVLYRTTPVAYVWDDHDFGPNDADSTSASKPAASAAYRQHVPHYPLASDGPTGTINQAFDYGRVRFVLTDTRSARSPASAPDDADKSMLGRPQRDWLLAELRKAKAAGQVAVWVNPDPWIVETRAGGDAWGAYHTERRSLANAIADEGLGPLLMLSGDAHMVAIDDGTHSDFSDVGGAGFPVFHAAPLDRPGSVKGGPYSEGAVGEAGQFGVVDVTDDGQRLTFSLSARDWTGAEVLGYQVTFEPS